MTGHDQPFNSMRLWLVAGMAIVALIFALQDTFATMLRHWIEIDTYNHCLLIAPVSAWLVWRQRHVLVTIEPSVSLTGLTMVVIVVAIWSLGTVASITIVQDVAAVGLIPLTIWSILGTPIARTIMFPLGYLLFLVPFGGFLIPPLMEFTADMTVAAVRASGVPIYRDGLFFEIPNGSFKIIEACSGIRMLTAGVAVGTLFAYLNFHSWRRRGIFLGGVVVLMLVANWIRAYLVVMAAHFSGMEMVADHVWVGYVVFAVVMVIMLWVGSRWSDIDQGLETDPGSRAGQSQPWGPVAFGRHLVMAGVIVSVVALAPYSATAVINRAAHATNLPIANLPENPDGWSGPAPARDDWSPVFRGDTLVQSGRYLGPVTIDVYIISYRSFSRQSELINENNRIFDPQQWMLIGQTVGSTASLAYIETEIRAPTGISRLVRHWYVVDGRAYRNRAAVKLIELGNSLLGRPTSAGVIAVSTRFDADAVQASRMLDEFMAEFAR